MENQIKKWSDNISGKMRVFKNERDGSSLPVRDKQSIYYILGKRVEVQILDTCEDPHFQSLLSIVYNCANGLFLCFDITNKQSFLALDNEVISAMEFEKSNNYWNKMRFK